MTEIYIFDCDGVIINSGADIAAAVNATFQHFGYWPVPEETLISFVGDGARALLIRALKYSTKNHFDETKSKKLDEILDWYLQYYYAHPVEKTTLYAGIKKFLRTLKEKNKKVAMLTNKSGKIAHEILAKFDILRYFDLIIAPETTDDNGEKIRQKPSPDGLSFALKKLNEKYGTSFVPENVIMVGDSKTDIQAGKAFGCKTVACRGGLGNTSELLAENADFCFSVASELEKFIDILSERDVEQTNLQKFAVKNEVPIMQDEGSDFICDYIVKNNARNILEIGTAIGYSAIKFARLREDIRVTTIEIDGDRFLAAERNIHTTKVAVDQAQEDDDAAHTADDAVHQQVLDHLHLQGGVALGGAGVHGVDAQLFAGGLNAVLGGVEIRNADQLGHDHDGLGHGHGGNQHRQNKDHCKNFLHVVLPRFYILQGDASAQPPP